jgi:hypothetical protein
MIGYHPRMDSEHIEPAEDNSIGEQSPPLTGTATSADEDEAERSYAGAGTPDEGDVQDDPGSQITG